MVRVERQHDRRDIGTGAEREGLCGRCVDVLEPRVFDLEALDDRVAGRGAADLVGSVGAVDVPVADGRTGKALAVAAAELGAGRRLVVDDAAAAEARRGLEELIILVPSSKVATGNALSPSLRIVRLTT